MSIFEKIFSNKKEVKQSETEIPKTEKEATANVAIEAAKKEYEEFKRNGIIVREDMNSDKTKKYKEETWKILDTEQEKTFLIHKRTGTITALISFEERDGKRYQINENFNVLDKRLSKVVNTKTVYEVKKEKLMPISLTVTNTIYPDKILEFQDFKKIKELTSLSNAEFILNRPDIAIISGELERLKDIKSYNPIKLPKRKK